MAKLAPTNINSVVVAIVAMETTRSEGVNTAKIVVFIIQGFVKIHCGTKGVSTKSALLLT